MLRVSDVQWDVLFPPSVQHPLVRCVFAAWLLLLGSIMPICARLLGSVQIGEPEQPPPRPAGAAEAAWAAAAHKPSRKGKDSVKGKGKNSAKGKGKNSGKSGAAGKGGGAAKGKAARATRSGKEAKRSSDDEGNGSADVDDDTGSSSETKTSAAAEDSDATSSGDDDDDARMELDAQALHGIPFTNVGNSCYVNSVVQLLSSVPPLREALLNAQLPEERQELKVPAEPAPLKKKADAKAVAERRAAIAKRSAALGQISAVALSSDLQRLAAEEPKGGVLRETMRVLVSDRATRIPGLRPKTQHDAAELAVSLLDRLRESSLFGAESAFGRGFGFTVVTAMTCECGHVSRRQQRAFALDLSLMDPAPFRTTRSCDLKALLDVWHGQGDFPEYFSCAGCRTPSHAQALCTIADPPPLLHLSLSRFRDDGSKRRDRITLPLRFSHAAIGHGAWYSLRGVVLHKGARATHGHYVTMGA